MERTKLCWAGRQETRLLCASTSTCRLGNRVTEIAALSEQKGRLKSLLFCFFYLYLQKALNIYLISYKALGGQVVDFKGRSRPVTHWVSCLMVVKVFLYVFSQSIWLTLSSQKTSTNGNHRVFLLGLVIFFSLFITLMFLLVWDFFFFCICVYLCVNIAPQFLDLRDHLCTERLI